MFLLLLFNTAIFYSQTIVQPNYGLKSHETLVINRVEMDSTFTTFFMTIENRIPDGRFCADKNIYIIYPDGTRSLLTSSNGIPVCPDEYKFKAPGEKLDFSLTFPSLRPGTEWVDLFEDCPDNCFSIYGITLDNGLNRKINEAFSQSEGGEPTKAMMSFIDLIESTSQKNPGIEGFLYINVIKLARENGNNIKAAEWYSKLKSSKVPRLEQYMKYLNDQGIKYQ